MVGVPCLVDQCAQRRPDRRAPARSTVLLTHAVQVHDPALVGIGGHADIGHGTLIARRDAWTMLPGRARKEYTLPAATAGPAGFRCDLAAWCQAKRRAAHRDDVWAGRHP